MHEGDGLGGVRKVMVYGVTGAGRTTAAARVSEPEPEPMTVLAPGPAPEQAG